MDITNASVPSLVEWDEINTGIYDGLGLVPVKETYFGSGDIPLPVELSTFTGKVI